MHSLSLKKRDICSCVWALWLLAMLYLCRDSIYVNTWIGFLPSYILQFVLFAMGFVMLLWTNKAGLGKLILSRRSAFAFCSAVVLLLPMLVKRDWQLMYFSVLFAVVYAVLVSFWIDLKSLSGLFVIVMTVLAAFSVVCTYGLRFLADNGISVPPVLINAIDTHFYNYGLSVVYIESLRWRCVGIFREPGVYQFFLILALYLHNDICEWNNRVFYWIINIILGFTMLATLAYGGIVEMALLVIVLFFEKGWYKNRRCQILAAAMILALVAAYNIIHWIDGPLWGEIWMLKHKFSMGGESVTDRFGSIIVNTKLFLQSPLFGTNAAQILYHPDILNNTSSTTIIMAMFGLAGAALHIGSWMTLTWKCGRCFVFNLLFALILAMSFNTENLIADIFLWLFPIMAVCEKILGCRGGEI